MSVLSGRLYVAAWLAMAAIASGYFVFLYQSAQTPAGIVQLPPASMPSASDETAATDPSVSQAIARMASEIDTLKSALDASRKENRALTAHVRTLESAFGPTTASLPPANQAAREKALDGHNTEDAKRENAPGSVEVEMRPMPLDGFSEDIERAPLPIAQPAKSTRTQFAVEIATGLSSETTKARWQELSKRHANLLGNLEPRKVRTSQEGTGKETYKLIAGPFNNVAAAALMCARLSIAGMNCSSTVFSGTPLGSVATR